jgi:hypothetical protein
MFIAFDDFRDDDVDGANIAMMMTTMATLVAMMMTAMTMSMTKAMKQQPL